MPLSIDVILNNKVLGPAFRRHMEENREQGRESGLEEGRLRGLVEGRNEGRIEGEVAMVRRFLESRFGTLPQQFEAQLRMASEAQLNMIADRALTAATLEDVFRTS
jgi:flagellar biosynthesis/type III secretory pathway protein FliH